MFKISFKIEFSMETELACKFLVLYAYKILGTQASFYFILFLFYKEGRKPFFCLIIYLPSECNILALVYIRSGA
jgi:hypothetical protein